MSTNGVNVCDDADMAEHDGDKVVTMMDVLKEQEDFEEDANAVLGASDDKNCTYSKGYIKRQAIYACMTCCVDAKNDPTAWAGVCLACSLNCHENHELIELYTKRNFRCDCGNPKFNSHPCQFTPIKTDLNVENLYNQNFGGVYCVCHRPYPDPDSKVEEEMIQCIICEDWLHSNHLDAVVPANDQYTEMICKACMDKNQFLHDYSEFAVNKDSMDVDILNTSSELNVTGNCHVNTNTNSKDNNANVATENINETNKLNCNDKLKCANEQEQEISGAQSPKKEDPNSSESVVTSTEKQDSVENTHSTKLNSLGTKDNVPVLNNDENEFEADTKNERETEESKSSIDMVPNNDEKYNSSKEEESKNKEDAITPDNQSQEQVEEDMLLADPVEANLDKLKDDTAPSDSNKSSLYEDKLKPDAMDTSESDIMAADKENTESNEILPTSTEPDSTPTTDQSECTTTNEHSESTPTADQSECTTTNEQSESTPTADLSECTTTNEMSESTQTADQSESTSIMKQSDNTQTAKQVEPVPTTDMSESISSVDHSESVATIKQTENEPTTEKTDSLCIIEQSKIDSTTAQLDSTNVIERKNENCDNMKDNSLDVEMNENNTENGDTKSNCNTENNLPDRSASEILKRKLSTDTEKSEVKKAKKEEAKCVRPRGQKKMYCGATFWASNFRQKLCTCNECISMYKDLSVLFLIDPEDTVTAYETLGKEKTHGKPVSQYEKGMAALSSLGRVQQINALTEYTKMRDKLLEFLKSFKDRKVIVKEEDIKAFFADMKPVREPDGVYFCR